MNSIEMNCSSEEFDLIHKCKVLDDENKKQLISYLDALIANQPGQEQAPGSLW